MIRMPGFFTNFSPLPLLIKWSILKKQSATSPQKDFIQYPLLFCLKNATIYLYIKIRILSIFLIFFNFLLISVRKKDIEGFPLELIPRS